MLSINPNYKYINLFYEVIQPADIYIMRKWNYNTTFVDCLKKETLKRVYNLTITPFSTIIRVMDIIVGVFAGFVSIANSGKKKAIFKLAMNHLDSSRKIVVSPYRYLLKTLNLSAEISYLYKSDWKKFYISAKGDGLITHNVSKFLEKKARSYYKSDRHFATRLTYALLALSSIITRVVDGIIGIIAAAFSFLTYGKVVTINNIAYRGLQAPGIVKDLFYCTIKIINPEASASSKTSTSIPGLFYH